MTTTYRGSTGGVQQQQGGSGQESGFEGIEFPLLFAALMRRRRDRGDRIMDHPLMLAALMRRRDEDGDTMIENPMMLAALAR